MAVTKTKAYHTVESVVQKVIRYSENKEKTSMYMDETMLREAKGINTVVDYAKNGTKTTHVAPDGHTEILVSGHNCKVNLAVETFQRTADEYRRNGHDEHSGKSYTVKTLLRAKLDKDGNPVLDKNGQMIHDSKAKVYHDQNGDPVLFSQKRVNRTRSCYMIVLSFPPPHVCGFDIDPRLVHQIGIELMEEIEKARGMTFPAVISTHLDRQHLHDHIVFSAYSLDGHHKYLDTMQTLQEARDIADRLSLKYDLPIILEPQYHETMNHDEWKLAQEGKSWKDNIRKEIAYNMEHATSYTDFCTRMYRSGYTLRETDKHITYYTPNKDHRCRDTNLGDDYTKEAIMAQFEKQGIEKAVQKEHEDIIDPTEQNNNTKPLRVYVSRYTWQGRRRSDLEMLLLKAIKIIKLLGDKFSDKEDPNSPVNPVRKNANWKSTRLIEAVGILNTYGIHTMKELDEKLLQVGAEYSHKKKDYSDISQGKEGLVQLQDMLENIKELQMIADSLGITDTYLIPPTQKAITENRAKLFPMTPSQRRELFLALQDRPMYALKVKYEQLTHDEAKDCIRFLQGKTDKQPKQIMNALDKETNLEIKYASIAERTLESFKKYSEGKVLPVSIKKILEEKGLPIDISKLTFTEGIHLAAYYKEWKPDFKICENSELLVAKAKAEQVKELLTLTKRELNIPVEQLSKKDADSIFRDLALSLITPDAVTIIQDMNWNENLRGLSYEERGYTEEYRTMARAVSALGYDINDAENMLISVKMQLQEICTEEIALDEIKKEYRTFKQLKMYTDLASTKQFTHGPKWKESDKDVVPEEVEETPDQNQKSQNNDRQTEEKVIDEEKEKGRRRFDNELDTEF